MNRPVVFAGPSIGHEEVMSSYDVECLPPIERGDIDALLARSEWPSAIGIIDGKFLHSLSISPKEVLRAVDRGIPTYGASSMGALRAVECAPYGMRGIGRIFDEFNTMRTDQEDEVAVTFDPMTLKSTSEPLISWRLALEDGTERGEVSSSAVSAFLGVAKGLYFPHRTLRSVEHEIGDKVTGNDLAEIRLLLGKPHADIKRLDGLALLETMTHEIAHSEARPEGVSYRALSTR